MLPKTRCRYRGALSKRKLRQGDGTCRLRHLQLELVQGKGRSPYLVRRGGLILWRLSGRGEIEGSNLSWSPTKGKEALKFECLKVLPGKDLMQRMWEDWLDGWMIGNGCRRDLHSGAFWDSAVGGSLKLEGKQGGWDVRMLRGWRRQTNYKEFRCSRVEGNCQENPNVGFTTTSEFGAARQ